MSAARFLPNALALCIIAALLAAWLLRATRAPRERRVPILLRGLAVIAFIVGGAVYLGPNPAYSSGMRGSKGGGLIPSGPTWSLLVGMLAAVLLMEAAQRYGKKRR